MNRNEMKFPSMRLAVPLCLAFAAALAVVVSVSEPAQAISKANPRPAAHAATLEEFVPPGWHLWQVRKGDLNNDSVFDAVLIMQLGDSDTYWLIVVFGNSAGGFDIAAENSELLTYVGDGSVAAPMSDDFKIRHGAFAVATQREGPGGAAEVTFTFRYQDGHFVLIGYDYFGDHSGWVKLSFNMLTGQVVETEGDFAAGTPFVEKRYTGTFITPKLVRLEDLGRAFDFDEKFNPFKYDLRRANQ